MNGTVDGGGDLLDGDTEFGGDALVDVDGHGDIHFLDGRSEESRGPLNSPPPGLREAPPPESSGRRTPGTPYGHGHARRAGQSPTTAFALPVHAVIGLGLRTPTDAGRVLMDGLELHSRTERSSATPTLHLPVPPPRSSCRYRSARQDLGQRRLVLLEAALELTENARIFALRQRRSDSASTRSAPPAPHATRGSLRRRCPRASSGRSASDRRGAPVAAAAWHRRWPPLRPYGSPGACP